MQGLAYHLLRAVLWGLVIVSALAGAIPLAVVFAVVVVAVDVVHVLRRRSRRQDAVREASLDAHRRALEAHGESVREHARLLEQHRQAQAQWQHTQTTGPVQATSWEPAATPEPPPAFTPEPIQTFTPEPTAAFTSEPADLSAGASWGSADVTWPAPVPEPADPWPAAAPDVSWQAPADSGPSGSGDW